MRSCCTEFDVIAEDVPILVAKHSRETLRNSVKLAQYKPGKQILQSVKQSEIKL
jgi:hypothetical protein